MKNDVTIVPSLIIHPDRVVCYKKIEGYRRSERKIKFDHLLESDKKNHGIVSDQTRRKIGKAVEYLLFMANDKYLPDTAHGKNYQFKISFITLTLPSSQMHSDNVIKSEMLNHFLTEARKKWKVINYIWRAEKQKNGNIHFHLLTDKFIPWSELRDVWNRISNKLNYVDNYRDQMRKFHSGGFKVRQDLLKKWDYKKQVKAYKAGQANDWNNPNSTDIHSLLHVHKVKDYICKYISKDEQDQEIEGRMWGCSESLSKIQGASEIIDSCFNEEIQSLVKNKSTKVYHADHFSVIHITVQDLRKFNCLNLYKLFCQYMFDQFNFNVQTKFS